MHTDSLQRFDAELSARLASLAGAAPLDLTALARVDLHEAVGWAVRFLLLPEIASPSELHKEGTRLDRRQDAVRLLYANTAALRAEELARAVRDGALLVHTNAIYDRARGAVLWEHPDLITPERRFDALRVALERVDAPGWRSHASTLVEWLALRLTEEPHLPGAPALFALHRAPETGRSLSDVVGATGDRALTEQLAADLGTPREDGGVIACVFALDPLTAFDTLGDRLADPRRRGPLLSVLAQDGFRTHPLAGSRSTRAMGWVRADPRWIAPLLALRDEADPNVARPAAAALGNADLDRVLALLPQPKKRVPTLDLALLGELPLVAAAYTGDAVWLGADRIVVADSPASLAVHALTPGLPVHTRLKLPVGVTLPERRAQAGSDPWDTVGLYDLALRADGAIALGAQTEAHEHVIALFDAEGTPLAQRTLSDDGPLFPHRLVFGAGGNGALWVALAEAAEHVIRACDPATLATLCEVRLGGAIPPPSWFEAATHPSEDVAVFAVTAGQDGAWLPIAERAQGAKAKLRKHKLSGKQAELGWLGLSSDGAVAAFAQGRQLVLRPWPQLDAPKKKRLDGTLVGGGAAGAHVALVVAEISLEPSAVELRRFADGERVAKGRYPIGERFVALAHGVLVTEVSGRLHVRTV